jgi:hypothetical protein
VTMTSQVRAASDDQAEFLAELIGHGLLIASGVPGVYGHGSGFEDVRSRLDERLSSEAGARGAERLRFPPVLPRRQLESSGYLSSFPHLAGSVYAFNGDERQAATQSERASRHEDWGEFQEMTELTLMPATRSIRRSPPGAGCRPAERSSTPGVPGCSGTSHRTTRRAARSFTSTSSSGSGSPIVCSRGETNGPGAGSTSCAHLA